MAAVVLLSAEPWDAVWRRNQHLAHQLVAQGLASALTFVEPATDRAGRSFAPAPGLRVLRPGKRIPNRIGGLALRAAQLRRTALRGADVLWVNDPPLGARCLDAGVPVVYDVTDDWRTGPLPPRLVRRVTRAEDALTRRAAVTVCSDELRARWSRRYGVDVPVVHNGIDAPAFAAAVPATLPGERPHAGYVGTLHSERLDVDAVLALARHCTVHLIGPDELTAADRDRLDAHPAVRLAPPVPAEAVPALLMSFDLLVCPHRVTEFTLSLDAIKSWEYLAAGRPIVATPTSGFQHLVGRTGVTVTDDVPGAAPAALRGPAPTLTEDVSWAARAREFAVALGIA